MTCPSCHCPSCHTTISIAEAKAESSRIAELYKDPYTRDEAISREDTLWEKVLRAVAAGDPDGRALAMYALFRISCVEADELMAGGNKQPFWHGDPPW